MATLDSIRASRSWAAGMSDAELLQVVADHAKAPLQNVADAFGVKTGQDRGVGMAGLSSGTDSLQGLGYSALGAVTDATGFNGAKDWALRNAARNKSEAELNGRPELERVEDQSLGSAVDFGMYQIAKQVPQIAGGLALGAVAPQAAIPAWLARGAASLPSAVGGGGLAAGASFAARRAALETGNTFARNLVGGAGLGSAMGAGSMYQESVDAGDPSPYAALGMAPLYGVTEGIPQAVLGGTLMKTAFNGNLLTRMAKSGGVNAAGGATSELTQNEMEMGFNPNLSDEEKFSRRLNSGVVGGLAEGTIGSVGGLRKATPVQPIADNEQRDLLNPTEPPQDPQRLGYSPLAGTPIVFPDGTVTLNGEQELSNRYPDTPFPGGPEPRPDLPETLYGVPGGGIVADAQNQNLLNADFSEDPGAELARQQWLDKRSAEAAKVQAQQQQAQELQAEAQRQQAEKARIESFGVPAKGDNHKLYQELETLRDEGAITPAQFTENAAKIVGETPVDRNGARKFVRDVVKAQQPKPETTRPASVPPAEEVATANDTPAPPADPMASTLAKLQEQAPKQPVAGVNAALVATETVAPKVRRIGAPKPAAAPALSPAQQAKKDRETVRLAADKITTLRGERKKLVKAKNEAGVADSTAEADIGDLGDVDPASDTGKRVAAIDQEIAGLIPDAPTLRKQVVGHLSAEVPASFTPVMQKYATDFKRRLAMLTGTELDGEGGLLQTSQPMTVAEVAQAEGVSPQAVSKQFMQKGLTKLHIDRLVASPMSSEGNTEVDVVDENDATSDSGSDGYVVDEKSIDDTSSRVSSSAARATGDGIVGIGGADMTPAQKQAEAEATKMVKALGKEAEAAPTEQDLAFEAKRREAARERSLQLMAQWALSPDGVNATKDWDFHRTAGSPRFAELTPEQQVHWLEAIYTTDERLSNDADHIRGLQRAYEAQNNADVPAAGAPGPQADVAGVPSATEGNTGPGADRGPVATPVAVKKRVVRDAQGRKINADVLGPDTATAAAINRDVTGPGIPNVAINADVLNEAVLKAATNPDMAGMETQIPAGVVFTNGAQAAGWLATNPKSEFVRDLMARLAPHLKGVPVHLLNVGDPAPVEVLTELNRKARGITAFDPGAVQGNPAVQVYIRSSDGNSETVWAHELLHAATMVRLQNGGDAVTRKIKTLARMVGLSLGTDRGAWPISNPTTRNAHEFFKSHFLGAGKLGDPDEFLAYAMTSPAFQGIMKKLDPNGQWLQEYKPEKTQVVPQRTLWHRFVDAILELFNLPRKHADEIEKIVQLNSEIEARNATEGGRATLQNSLDRLLGELLSSPTPAAQGLPAAPVLHPSGTEGLTRAKFTPIKSGNKAIDAMPDALANFYTLVKQKASDAGVRIMLTRDLAAIAAKNGLTAATKYMAAMDAIGVEKTKSELAVQSVLAEFRTLPKHEQGTGPSSVNQLLNDSTTKGVWAFVPGWLPSGAVTADPALEARMRGMSDAAQALVKKVFKHGFDTRKAMQEAATTNITTEYDGLISALKAAGKVEEAAKETKAKIKSLDDFKSLFSQNPNAPYAPLKRFGRYVVMGMSARYLQAEKEGNLKEMRALETNGDDYYVEFAETQAQANKLERDIEGSFPGGYTTKFEKLDHADGMMGGRDMLGALGRLRRMAKEQASEDGTKDTASAAVDNLMRQMYLQLLSENSARKGEIHRRNISGANKDMMRAFSTQGIATAHFIASLKTSGKVDDNLDAMRNQVRERTPGRDGRQRVFNELMRRHSLNLEFSPTPFVDKALATSSLYLLLSNPSYFLMNATQPWMMSHPMMAGKHGYSRSATALLTASKEVAMLLKNASFDVKDYNKLPQDVQRAVEALADKGVIDISLAADLGTFRSNDGGVTEPLSKVMGMLRGAAESVETFNRLSTAIAAYRLEKQRGSTDTQAVDYAANLIVETHGDYSGFNAPRFMRSGLGRVLTQFRKFQLIQLSMFARLLNRSLAGATADEKLIARKALVFNMAHLGAIGGAVALPGFTAVSWLLGAVFGDEDEPDDVKGTVTRIVGEEWAGLLLGGASQALGVPLGERIGAGGMFSILPYTELELSRTGYEKAFMAATGPLLGGLLPRAVDGMGMALNGDPWKGSEALMPALGANISKAIRFGTEGITKRSGGVALSADELGTLDLLGQAVGLQTAAIKDHYARGSTEFKTEKFYNARTSDLKKAYIEAVRSNDADGIREAREDWMTTQAARRRVGLEAQPLSALTRAPAERAAAEAKDRRQREALQ